MCVLKIVLCKLINALPPFKQSLGKYNRHCDIRRYSLREALYLCLSLLSYVALAPEHLCNTDNDISTNQCLYMIQKENDSSLRLTLAA